MPKKIMVTIDKVSSFFGAFAGIIMVIGAIMMIVEIFARTLFNSTIYITTEYVGYFMVAVTFFGLAITLKDKEHIRVSILYQFIKKRNTKFILDLFTLVVGLVIFIFITVNSYELFWNAVVSKTKSIQITKTYLAIPMSFILIGSFTMLLQFVAEIIREIINFREGKDNIKTENTMLGR